MSTTAALRSWFPLRPAYLLASPTRRRRSFSTRGAYPAQCIPLVLKLLLALSTLFSVTMILFLSYGMDHSSIPCELQCDDERPYDAWWERERLSSPRNSLFPPPESEDGFLFIEGHMYGIGLNNFLLEYFLNALLSYESRRSFVFYPFAMDGKSEVSWVMDHGKLIPSQIPVSAILSGSIVGDFIHSDPASERQPPHGVSVEHFSALCPNPYIVTDQSIQPSADASAEEILMTWAHFLSRIEARCVRLDMEKEPIFRHFAELGQSDLVDIWPRFSTSPILTNMGWSQNVHSALQSNARIVTSSPEASALSSNRPFIAGLLAIHVRRGDFEGYCQMLRNTSSTFHGFNNLPMLPDRFEPPRDDTFASAPLYARSCYPSISDIVSKIADVRKSDEGRSLKRVYIMTNGHARWTRELQGAIRAIGGWDLDEAAVTVGSDLVLTKEQYWVAQAVDMDIAQAAEIFIGNGFSSMTANVVVFRLMNDRPVGSNRFW